MHNVEDEMAADFQTKKDLALARLRNAIQTGQYKPGERLRQNDLARELGLSSTPVREALLHLLSTGLLTAEAHRGVQVADLNLERIQRIYTARNILERETAKMAFAHITPLRVTELQSLADQMQRVDFDRGLAELVALDEAFHMLIFEASGNEFMIKAVRDTWDAIPKYLVWNVSKSRLKDAMVEHLAIVGALRAREKADFIGAVDLHVRNSRDTMVDFILDGSKDPSSKGA